MQFSTLPLDDPQKALIAAVGEIIPGDFDRLIALLRSLPATTQIQGFTLDSPGGNALEAEKVANALRRIDAGVGVFGQDRCVSSCFLLFAAGTRRLVSSTALIGVHSASVSGAETSSSMAVTIAMARDATGFGVPPAIVGKMVSAEPGRVEWLTRLDLISMGVNIIEPDPAPPSVASGTSQPNAPPKGVPTVAMLPPVVNQESLAFQQGLGDRQSWEHWFASLSGFNLDGATFWAAHRSDPDHPSCSVNLEPRQGGAGVSVYMDGCLSARTRLAASDIRRKNEPEYRRGWNSY